MKKEKKLIKILYSKINTIKELDELEEIGLLRNSYNNIYIYESTNEFFNTIIITDLIKKNIKRISFSGEHFKISLQDLNLFFGKYEVAYNFKDNYTSFFFLNSKGKNISKIFCEKQNNIIREQDFFYEYSLKSKIGKKLEEKDIVFDNIIFEVKN